MSDERAGGYWCSEHRFFHRLVPDYRDATCTRNPAGALTLEGYLVTGDWKDSADKPAMTTPRQEAG